MGYDPTCDGAECDRCPLGPYGDLKTFSFDWRPIKTEHYDGAKSIVVLDAPNKEDERSEHYFSSSEVGGPWLRALWELKGKRDDFSVTSVLACRPPGPVNGAYRRMEDKLKRLNKRRNADGLDSVPHPEECCRPRLLKAVDKYDNILTFGKVATQSLTGVRRGIKKVRGSPWKVDGQWNKVSEDYEGFHRKLLPTYSPGYVDRSPAYFDRWIHDIRKFLRFTNNALNWEEPSDILWRPTPAEFAQWIADIKPTFHSGRKAHQFTKPIICYDVETPKHRQGLRPSQIPMRTIAFARWEDGIEDGPIQLACISLLSTDGVTRFYSEAEEKEIIALCCELLTDESVLKIGHNAGQFDRLNVEANFYVTPTPLLDTILPARAANPSIPKGLKPTGRTYCDVGEWDSDDKEESIATGSTDDAELLKYNGTDVQVNLKIWPELRRLASATGYFGPIKEEYLTLDWWPHPGVPSLCDIDHERQDRGVRMTKVGLWIDQAKRGSLEAKGVEEYTYIWNRLQRLLQAEGIYLSQEEISGDEMNPNSTRHLRWLYFDKWDLPPLWESGIKDDDGEPIYSKKDFLTTNGDLSTSDVVHRHYIASGVLNRKQAEIMQLVRVFRRIRGKIVGTTLRPLAPEKLIMGRNGRSKGFTKSFLYPDNRIHSSFSAHLTNVGRYSSRGPNVQNIGNKKGQGPLKKVFAAPPGRVFYGADVNQAHLFIIANVWKIPALCEAIRKGYDPHNYNAYTTFGKRFTGAQGYNGLKKKPDPGSTADAMRNTIKIFIYASVYGASPATVWRVLTATEFDLPDNWHRGLEEGTIELDIFGIIQKSMPYMHMKPLEVVKLHEAWLRGQPEWEMAWQKEQDFYRDNGYVQSYLFNRKSGNLGDDVNKAVNFGVLATEPEIMAMIEGRIEKRFPRDQTGPGTGIIYQCHDSIAVEWALPSDLPRYWKPQDVYKPEKVKYYKRSDLPKEIRELEEIFEDAFTLNIPGWEFPISGEASTGRTLKDVT